MTLCPICRKHAAAPHAPFCSPRCAEIDLGRWLTGQYVVPGTDGEALDMDEAGKIARPLDPPKAVE